MKILTVRLAALGVDGAFPLSLPAALASDHQKAPVTAAFPFLAHPQQAQ